MGVYLAPRPVTSGLKVHLDVNNVKSYVSGSTIAYGLSNTIYTGALDTGVGSQLENAGIRVFTHQGDAGAEINITPDEGSGIGSDIFPFYEFTFDMAFKCMGTVPVTGTQPGLIGFTYGLRTLIRTDGYLQYGTNVATTFYNIVHSGSGDLRDKQWHIFQWVNQNQSSSIYIDGVKMRGPESQPWTGSTGYLTNTTNIARDNNNSNYQFTGSIGYFKLYERALSEEELTQNFEAVRRRYGL